MLVFISSLGFGKEPCAGVRWEWWIVLTHMVMSSHVFRF